MNLVSRDIIAICTNKSSEWQRLVSRGKLRHENGHRRSSSFLLSVLLRLYRSFLCMSKSEYYLNINVLFRTYEDYMTIFPDGHPMSSHTTWLLSFRCGNNRSRISILKHFFFLFLIGCRVFCRTNSSHVVPSILLELRFLLLNLEWFLRVSVVSCRQRMYVE